MAVRDEQQRPNMDTKVGQALPRRDTLGHLSAIVLVSGLLIYGYLSLCYERFYQSLGVDPNDVGLSYAGTLARSSGFVATVIGIVMFAYPVFIFFLVRGRRQGWDLAHGSSRSKRRFVVFVLIPLLSAFPLLFFAPLNQAEMAASDVKAGRAVGPIRVPDYLLPLVGRAAILAIHADPATVEPIGKSGDSPATERLRNRRLLYLGQSGGMVVLYDADVQQAVYAPAASIFLHITNCEANPPPDPAC